MARVDGLGSTQVLIVGGFCKDSSLTPFDPCSRAGSVLSRAINRIACRREMFWILEHSNPDVIRSTIAELKPKAIVALGDIALSATTGLAGHKLSCDTLTGYVLPSFAGSVPVIPMFHPDLLRGGHMSLFGVLMRCLRLAIQVAKEMRQPIRPSVDAPSPQYQMYPTESAALEFLASVEERTSTGEKGYLAYDIETNYSTSEEDAEERTGDMRSIQFSTRAGSGIFLPWREPFKDVAQRILATSIPKITWNGWRFDDPILRENGCTINGSNFDLMWAWHHAQPDLPRGLQFAAAMQGPTIYTPSHSWPWPWKHLDNASPQFYGIVDVDVLQWLVSY